MQQRVLPVKATALDNNLQSEWSQLVLRNILSQNTWHIANGTNRSVRLVPQRESKINGGAVPHGSESYIERIPSIS